MRWATRWRPILGQHGKIARGKRAEYVLENGE